MGDEEIIEESKEKIEPTVSTPADKTEEKKINVEEESKATSTDETPEPKEAEKKEEEKKPSTETTTEEKVKETPKKSSVLDDLSDDESSSDEITMPTIPKAPTTWPELPDKVDPESVKTAQDKEWWDDEILKCAIAQL